MKEHTDDMHEITDCVTLSIPVNLMGVTVHISMFPIPFLTWPSSGRKNKDTKKDEFLYY